MVLENEQLLVKFKYEGSEWTSLYDKKRQLEFAWQGKEQFWAGRNPTLFPVVGKLWQETYRLGENTFHLGNHGFARRSEFKLVSQTQKSLALELNDSEQTRTDYPFAFRLTNTYELEEKTLTVTTSVFNKDKKDLPFSVGAHPAFNCPLLPGEKLSDYQIIFEQEEKLRRLKMNPADSSFVSEREDYGTLQRLPLTYDLFADDALVFEAIHSNWIKLAGPKAGVRMSFGQPVTWLGLWTKPNAPFICLEPWQGHGDFAEYDGDFKQREGTILLPPGVSFDFSYSLSIE